MLLLGGARTAARIRAFRRSRSSLLVERKQTSNKDPEAQAGLMREVYCFSKRRRFQKLMWMTGCSRVSSRDVWSVPCQLIGVCQGLGGVVTGRERELIRTENKRPFLAATPVFCCVSRVEAQSGLFLQRVGPLGMIGGARM